MAFPNSDVDCDVDKKLLARSLMKIWELKNTNKKYQRRIVRLKSESRSVGGPCRRAKMNKSKNRKNKKNTNDKDAST